MSLAPTRLAAPVAAALTAAALAAAPALAGTDGNAQGPPAQPPAQTVPDVPVSATPAPPQSTAPGSDGSAPRRTERVELPARWVANRRAARNLGDPGVSRTVGVQASVPQGGVQAGAGGAAGGPSRLGVLLGMVGGALALIAAGGRLARRAGS
jgi:hypothetical protein